MNRLHSLWMETSFPLKKRFLACAFARPNVKNVLAIPLDWTRYLHVWRGISVAHGCNPRCSASPAYRGRASRPSSCGGSASRAGRCRRSWASCASCPSSGACAAGRAAPLPSAWRPACSSSSWSSRCSGTCRRRRRMHWPSSTSCVSARWGGDLPSTSVNRTWGSTPTWPSNAELQRRI